jgi:hypothetical protein
MKKDPKVVIRKTNAGDIRLADCNDFSRIELINILPFSNV